MVALACIAGPGSRLFVDDAEQPTGDVASLRFPNAVARSTDQTTKDTAFQGMGWNAAMSEPYDNARGWVYTATPASLGISTSPVGETRVLVQEFFPYAMRPRATITGATSANPIVFTMASTASWTTGSRVQFTGLPGSFAALNGSALYNATVINGTTLSVPVDGSGFGAYTSGGEIATAYNDIQPNPYVEWQPSSEPEGTLPANVYFRYWTMLVEEFDADIGSGTQSFTSTIQSRNKNIYPSRATDPPYPATFTSGLNWDLVPGSLGFEDGNEHIAVPGSFPTDEIFLALDTAADDFGAGGADNQLASDDLQHRLYQNLNNTTGKIVKGVWTEITLHFDTSSAYGVWRAWIKPEGQSRIQVAHWVDSRHADAVALGGGTADFVWDIPVGQRVGHRTFRLNPVYGGFNGADYGDMMLVTSAIDIATSWDDLPDYDA
jgi:hypothetical protein